MLDTNTLKKDFPILEMKVNGKDLVYLDNAATTQKPEKVLAAVDTYYRICNANVHRGSHTLSDNATSLYERSRESVAKFIGAKPTEIIFTRNATEGINLVAYSYGLATLHAGDEILIGGWEHHSNLVPWQEVCHKTGARLVYTYPDNQGLFDFADFCSKLGARTKIVAVGHASNVLGTIYPVAEIAAEAKKVGALVVVDGAQSLPHLPVNIKQLSCDALAFSGHKMLGPMGIGVLWLDESLQESLSPFLTGGGMVLEVDENKASWEKPPHKFEAGTPNVSGAVGLAAAIDYIKTIGIEEIRKHEIELSSYALQAFADLARGFQNLRILGPMDATKRTGLISFHMQGVHAHDVSAILDQRGIAVRSGYHCAMPLHTHLGIGPTVRASWYLYNSQADITALVSGISDAKKILLA